MKPSLNKKIKRAPNRQSRSKQINSDLLLTAYHEAGHIICGILNFCYIQSSKLIHSNYGITKYKYFVMVSDKPTPLDESIFHSQLSVLLAGQAAEQILIRELFGSEINLSKNRASSEDFKEVSLLLRKNKIPADVGKSLKRAIQNLIIDKLTEHWSCVRALAHFLISNKSLKYDQIKLFLTNLDHDDDGFWRERYRVIESIYGAEIEPALRLSA